MSNRTRITRITRITQQVLKGRHIPTQGFIPVQICGQKKSAQIRVICVICVQSKIVNN